MDYSLILINAIVVLSIFVPYYLFIRAGKSADKKRLQDFKNIAREHHVLPNIEERWGTSYIGVDSLENALIYIHFKGPEQQTKLISLDKVKRCQLIKRNKTIRRGNLKEEVLEYLGIMVEIGGSGQVHETLTFYDVSEDTTEDHELARAEKWLGIIKEHLRPNKPARLAA